MPAPKNKLKARLSAGDTVYGCWTGFANAYAAEVTGRAGFDWVLIDGEHAPNTIETIAAQLQVLEYTPADAIVRLPMDQDWMIKQALDAGAQTLLIPLVESGEQADRIVRATRYAPAGHRGMGAALARASHVSEIADYSTTANDEICVIVQVETARGVAALDDILAVEGVDGVFIGPADLSADMGYPGNPKAPEVWDTIADCLRRIEAAGKAAGVMSTDDTDTPGHIANGARFLAVGIDITMMAAALRAKAAKWCKS